MFTDFYATREFFLRLLYPCWVIVNCYHIPNEIRKAVSTKTKKESHFVQLPKSCQHFTNDWCFLLWHIRNYQGKAFQHSDDSCSVGTVKQGCQQTHQKWQSISPGRDDPPSGGVRKYWRALCWCALLPQMMWSYLTVITPVIGCRCPVQWYPPYLPSYLPGKEVRIFLTRPFTVGSLSRGARPRLLAEFLVLATLIMVRLTWKLDDERFRGGFNIILSDDGTFSNRSWLILELILTYFFCVFAS